MTQLVNERTSANATSGIVISHQTAIDQSSEQFEVVEERIFNWLANYKPSLKLKDRLGFAHQMFMQEQHQLYPIALWNYELNNMQGYRAITSCDAFGLSGVNTSPLVKCDVNLSWTIPVTNVFVMPLVSREIEIAYINQTEINNLLGSQGQTVLDRVISLIKEVSIEKGWPLIKVKIAHNRDSEVKEWEQVILTLIFNSSFKDADSYLQELYPRLDLFANKLNGEDRSLFEDLIFFDIEAISNVRNC